MNPNADQIAEAVIAASIIAKVDAIDVMTGKVVLGTKDNVPRARRLIALAMAGCWDRPLCHWPYEFGWSKNRQAATVYISQAKNAGIHHTPEFEIVCRELGRDPELVWKRLEMRRQPARKPSPKSGASDDRSKCTKPSPSKLAALKAPAYREPVRKPAPKPAATEATPLDLSFAGTAEIRLVERVQLMRKANTGFNDIRNALLNEHGSRKSIDWIRRACVTELTRDAA